MQSALKEIAVFHDAYRFFDLSFVVRSDSPQALAPFRDKYSRFRLDRPDEAEATYYVIAGDSPLGRPAVVVDDRTYLVDDPNILVAYAYTSIVNSVYARIRSHFLIHGAAVSLDDQAIILPAYSGYGKTTLVMELVRRGFQFLSDDIAAINRSNRLTDPFPRSLGIREGTLALCGGIVLDHQRFLPSIDGGRIRILDIEHVRGGSIGEACPGGYLIVLTTSSEENGADRWLHVTLNRVDDALVVDLRRIAGLQDVVVLRDGRFPVLKIKRDRAVRTQIEETCYEHGALVFDMAKRDTQFPDFGASPRLEAISKTEAVMELIRRFRGGPRSAILRHEYQGNGLGMFVDLLDIVADMRCYRLTVGRLDEMAGLICRLVDGSGWPAA